MIGERNPFISSVGACADDWRLSQGLGRALRHVLRFCCLFVVHGDATDIIPAEVTALHDAFQDEMNLLVPVR